MAVVKGLTRRILPVCAVFDFDGTLSLADTTSEVMGLSSHFNSLPVQSLITEYYKNYDAVLESSLNILLQKCKNNDINRLNTLSIFLESIDQTSINSINEITNSKALQGIKQEDIFALRTSRMKLLKPYAIESLQAAKELCGTRSYILSVNWSKDLIQTLLDSSDIKVYANNLEYANDEKHKITTGNILGDIHTASAKLDYFERIISEEPCISVYVGDSLTDLLCLIKANTGILAKQPNQGMQTVLKAMNIDIIPLNPQKTLDEMKDEENILYSIDSMKDMKDWLLYQSN